VNFIGISHSPNRKSFSDWVVESLKKGTPITVFEDVLISPLNIKTLCRLIELVSIKKIPGIFNLASSGGASKAHIAKQLCVTLGLNCNLLINGLLGAGNSRIKRPLDMRMNAELFEQVYNLRLPSIENEIELTANEYLNVMHGKI
jgi:dTDP-4-dehydrorhamnose reductase